MKIKKLVITYADDTNETLDVPEKLNANIVLRADKDKDKVKEGTSNIPSPETAIKVDVQPKPAPVAKPAPEKERPTFIVPEDKTVYKSDFDSGEINLEAYDVTNYTSGVRDETPVLFPKFSNRSRLAGKHSMKFELEPIYDGKPIERMELQAFNTKTKAVDKWKAFNAGFEHGKEYTMRASVFIHDSWVNDPKADCVIFQVHGKDGQGGQYDVPLLSLMIKDGKWGWNIAWNSTTDSSDGFGRVEDIGIHDIPKHKWVDIVIKFKLDTTDGYTKIWHDGKLVVNHEGGNTYKGNVVFNGKTFASFVQGGIYIWGWSKKDGDFDSRWRKLYWDEILVLEGSFSVEDMKI